MTDYEVMPMDEYVSELVRSKYAELATLRAENDRLRPENKMMMDFLVGSDDILEACKKYMDSASKEALK